MPPVKKTEFRQHFVYNESDDVSVCEILNDADNESPKPCAAVIKGDHNANLERHVKKHHPSIYNAIEKKRKDSNNSNRNITAYGDYKVIKKRIVVECTSKLIEQSVLKKVTVDGRPFTSVEDESYQLLLRPLLKGLEIKKMIDRKYARKLVQEYALKLISNMQQEINGRMICLKLDGGVRVGRRFLGINLQYRDGNQNGKFKMITLSCIELKDTCTSENLKTEIMNVLSKFRITIDQVYCATTDNGANYVKSVKLLQGNENEECESTDLDLDDDFEIAEQYEFDIDDEDYVMNEIKDAAKNMNFFSIKCVEHTFQLAVRDWLKANVTDSNILQKVRKMVTKCRTPNMEQKLKKKFKKKMILDNATRWSSTFLMVGRFLEAKKYLTEFEDLFDDPLSSSEWLLVENLQKILEPCRIATLAFQKNEAIFTELYKYWMLCDLALENLHSVSADNLRKEMEKRETTLFDNVCFSSALFLDPRFKSLLSPTRKQHAVDHLRKLKKKIDCLNLAAPEENQNNNDELGTNDSSNASGVYSTDCNITSTPVTLNDRIKRKSFLENVSNTDTDVGNDDVGDESERYFLNVNDISADSSQETVLNFWNSQKKNYPILYQVSQVVFSIPGTQVSVERLFSEMKFVINDLRASLLAESVNDIMLIRRNFSLLEF